MVSIDMIIYWYSTAAFIQCSNWRNAYHWALYMEARSIKTISYCLRWINFAVTIANWFQGWLACEVRFLCENFKRWCCWSILPLSSLLFRGLIFKKVRKLYFGLFRKFMRHIVVLLHIRAGFVLSASYLKKNAR